ncbi:MAG TPA: methyltransferase domain-containing protein [Candidatus Anaerobiospirillum stercoravium]|nr:methyltransferase domain-containing protein [Candidatus Anaerobiospirillum stercoravium]
MLLDLSAQQPQPTPERSNAQTVTSSASSSASACPPPETVVLVLGAGLGSEPFIETLLRLGVSLVVMDHSPQLSPELLASPLAQKLTVLSQDFSDLSTVDAAIAAHQVTHTLALPVGRSLMYLGQVNSRYHFTGPKLSAIDHCTDKHKFHQLLTQAGLPAPRYLVLPARSDSKHLGLSPAEQEQAVRALGLPLIVKPAEGCGSRGVRVCRTEAELAAYQVPGAFASGELLLEQMIAGTEYSVNFFVDANGSIHMLGLFQKELSPLPYRQEVAYFVGDFSAAFAHIKPVITQLIATLGPDCHNSFFNIDTIVDAHGVAYLIDTAPRLGGNLLYLLEQRYGIDPVALFVRHLLNHEPLESIAPPESLPRPSTCATLRFLSFAHEGTISAIHPVLSADERRGVVLERNQLTVGAQVGPMSDGGAVARGMVLVEHPQLAEAQRISRRYLASFELTPTAVSAEAPSPVPNAWHEQAPACPSFVSKSEMTSITDASKPLVAITYQDYECCPLCGSKHFTSLPPRREMIQATPLAPNELNQNAIITFTPALCEECGLVFNLRGLSNESRDLLYDNYKFVKASTGVGASNYQTYIDTVKRLIAQQGLTHDAAIIEVGGYDGYLLQVLAQLGYRNLTLIDPSAQVDNIPPELGITALTEFFGRATAQRYPEYFDLIACKDTINMVPPLPDFIQGLVECLKPGGTMLLTCVEPNSMHALQCSRLGRNAFAYIAHAYGLQLVDYFKRPENSYGCAILHKPQRGAAATLNQTSAQPSTQSFHDAAFNAEQERLRPLLNLTTALPLSALQELEHKVKQALAADGPIIIYGTGFATFQLLDNLSPKVKAQLLAEPAASDTRISTAPRLILVNSSPEQEGYYFLLPNGKHHKVHYAKSALPQQHAALLIIGAQNHFFQQEIKATLAQLECSYDDLFALPEA